MKKRLVTALCSALAVATALPAFALESQFTGFYRAKGIMGDPRMGKDTNKKPDWLSEQRLRFQYRGIVNEYLQFTYMGEFDFMWGDTAYTNALSPVPGTTPAVSIPSTRNKGGAIGGSGVNLETKYLYMTVKVPDSPVTATVGFQAIGDNWNWAFGIPQAPGVKITAANLAKMLDVTAYWLKAQEGDGNGVGVLNAQKEDDVDVYGLQLQSRPTKDTKAGLDFYWWNNQGQGGAGDTPISAGAGLRLPPGNKPESLVFVGVNGSYKLPIAMPTNLSGWVATVNGKQEGVITGGGDLKINSYAGTLKVDTAGKDWGAWARLVYFPADSNVDDNKQKQWRSPLGADNGPAPFLLEGSMFMFGDMMALNYLSATPGRVGSILNSDGILSGYGLMAGMLSGSYSPSFVKNSYVKGLVGYAVALKDDIDPSVVGAERAGKTFGAEVSARVGYKFAKNLDLSLNAGTFLVGDFYDKTVGPSGLSTGSAAITPAVANNPGSSINVTNASFSDPDNPYVVYVMAQLDF
jgi:hypothetical protein